MRLALKGRGVLRVRLLRGEGLLPTHDTTHDHVKNSSDPYCELVDTAAALASGSAPRPSLPQPWARVLPLVLGSAVSRFEATHQPSSGLPKAAYLRPNPHTGTPWQ
jgi:hypothetical protein